MLAALAFAAGASALPIADTGLPTLPPFSGAAATKHKIKDPTIAPQNPFMARNPNSNIHNDTWMTDAYQHAGPVGRKLETATGAHAPSLCGSIAFDSAGHLVSICPSMFAAPQARVFDPKTLEILATYDMPNAPNPPDTLAECAADCRATFLTPYRK